MHKFFVCSKNISDKNINIIGDDVNHIVRVLRLKIGDQIIASDGNGNEFICSISDYDKKYVVCDIIEKKESIFEPPIIVDLYQGIPKSSKMDIIIQKCTELGINSIVPLNTLRVVVREGQDMSNKIIRYERIALEASKQSGRGRIPEIKLPIEFDEALKALKQYDLVIMPYEKELSRGLKQILRGKNNTSKVAVLIGPEGGFTENEVCVAKENGASIVTLGPRILRTETAGFAVLSMIMYELGDMGGNM